jgi:hypothetical protein
MKKNNLCIILVSMVLIFSFVVAGFARRTPNGKRVDNRRKSNTVKNIILNTNKSKPIDSMADRIAVRKAFSEIRGYTRDQIIRRSLKRKALNSKKELFIPAETEDVPGGGDIFEAWGVTFDLEDDFLLFDLLDLSEKGLGNDWMWLDYTQLGFPVEWNSAFAPEPGGDFGGEVGARDEAIEITVGVPEEASDGTPYKVCDLILGFYIGEPDPDDYLSCEIKEPPKWHIEDGEWAMTSNQYSVPGYGSVWREDLRTPFIDLTNASGNVTLTFDHTYDMESGDGTDANPNWDGGNIWARSGEDSEWELLIPDVGYAPGGLYAWYYHLLTDAWGPSGGIPAFSGALHTPETVTMDLSAYKGGKVQVRWAFASDGGYDAQEGFTDETLGWFIDNIDISDAGGTIFSNDGSETGDMEAIRLGPGEFGPWEEVGSWSEYGGEGIASKITLEVIGLPGDSLNIRFRAVYDDNDEGDGADPNWGFEVDYASLMVYTRLAKDIGVTFVDLDSALTNLEGVVIGESYDPQVVVSNFGLDPFAIYNTYVKILNIYGTTVYERFIYTYAPGQGDTLDTFPGIQVFNNNQAFYNFPDWVPMYEGDYTLMAYTDVFGGDDQSLDDSLVVNFHVHSNTPVFMESFNVMSDSILYATWNYNDPDSGWFIGDLFEEGDTELWFFDVDATVYNETVLSPPFNCSGQSNMALRFQSWIWHDFDSTFASNVIVTNNGGTTFDTVKSVDMNTPGSLRNGFFILDISKTADGQNAVQIGFTYESSIAPSGPAGYCYITIDDIAVFSNPDLTPPAVPANLSVTAGDMEASLKWNEVPAVAYYMIYSDSAGNWDDAIPVGNTNDSTYIDKGLTNNKPVSYWVTAIDFNENESDPSSPDTVVPVDVTPPTKVKDLKAVPASSIMLTWTTPVETAPEEGSYYDIRYSLLPITENNWNRTVKFGDEPSVGKSGTQDTLIIDTWKFEGDIYFALKTVDEVGHISPLSNVANSDIIPPGKITDLKIIKVTETEITLQWTARGDDGDIGGPAFEYDLRVAYSADLGDFNNAAKLLNVPKPGIPGTVQTFITADNVFPAFVMAFAMKVKDNNNNWSEISNIDTSEIWTTGITQNENRVPETFILDQNYPNPFNPITSITFQLPVATRVILEIINTTGQKIRTLINKQMNSGYHKIGWDSLDDRGNHVASGLYLLRIHCNEFRSMRRMILLK